MDECRVARGRGRARRAVWAGKFDKAICRPTGQFCMQLVSVARTIFDRRPDISAVPRRRRYERPCLLILPFSKYAAHAHLLKDV